VCNVLVAMCPVSSVSSKQYHTGHGARVSIVVESIHQKMTHGKSNIKTLIDSLSACVLDLSGSW
jgi:hypothetical protein